MFKSVHRSATRRGSAALVTVGVIAGLAPAAALAIQGNWAHTYALWNHGYDGNHVYMSSTDGNGRTGGVGGNYITGGRTYQGPWTNDTARHIHNDYNASLGLCYYGGNFRSSQTGLSEHPHNSSGC